MRSPLRISVLRQLFNRLVVVAAAPVLTAFCFVLLPLIESMGQTHRDDTIVRSVEEVVAPPPPPPPEPEQKQDEDTEEKPPDLQEELPLPDLSQLEMALNPGSGDGFGFGDGGLKIDALGANAAADTDSMFAEGVLEQQARPVYQASPTMTAEMRRKAPGAVNLVFTVDLGGRVQDAVVQSSTDPAFDHAALVAIRQWRFEPALRDGKPCSSRAKITITFPKN